MPFDILAVTRDLRSKTNVLYVQLDIPQYLTWVGDDFDKFHIQRDEQQHKVYERLREDVKLGALLPPITLALKKDYISAVDSFLPSFDPRQDSLFYRTIKDKLSRPGSVNILDGLQRTIILRNLSRAGHVFDKAQRLLVEIWVEPEIKHLIYRLIVLNAGQKPMTMRHQVELLFLSMQTLLQNKIPGLELYLDKDDARRTRARQFAMDRVATAYEAFISRIPDVDKENVVAKRLMNEQISTLSEDALDDDFKAFLHYLDWYAKLDDEIFRVYSNKGENFPAGPRWFGSENVLAAFFAAAADVGRDSDRQERVEKAITALFNNLLNATFPVDVLGLTDFEQIRAGFNPRKANVGRLTRHFIFRGFKEFFREEGRKGLAECWRAEAE